METTKTIELITAIQNGDDQSINKLYHWYRERLMSKIKKRFSQISLNIIEDAYHDALWVVVEKYIKTNKVTVSAGVVVGLKKNSLEALLYFIMKCNIIKHIRWQEKHATINLEKYFEQNIPTVNVASPITDDLVMKAFKMLRPLCQQIITSRLLNGNSFKNLAAELDSNEGVLRVQNHRCIKQLIRNYKKLSEKECQLKV